MAKSKKDDILRALKDVEQTLTWTEQLLEENYKVLLTGLAVLVALVALFWLGRMYLMKRNDEAPARCISHRNTLNGFA